MSVNQVEIVGRVSGNQGLRHTPAGLPTCSFRLVHASQQTEANRVRQVECEIESLAFGDVAAKLALQPDAVSLKLIGFLDRKGLRNPTPILHVTEFKII